MKKLKEALLARSRKSDTPLSVIPYVEEGVVSPGKFNPELIKSKLDALVNLMSGGNFDLSDFYEHLLELVNLSYGEFNRAKAKIHPSTIKHDCPRRVVFELSGYKPDVSIKPNAALQRIFDQGTWWHTYIQRNLQKSGVLEAAEVPTKMQRYFVDGRADAVLNIKGDRLLLEIKTMNSFQFSRLLQPVEHHVFQATVYAKILKLEKIAILYINKDSGAFREFIVPANEADWEYFVKLVQFIKYHVKNELLPKRICETKNDKAAKKCNFCNTCFKQKR